MKKLFAVAGLVAGAGAIVALIARSEFQNAQIKDLQNGQEFTLELDKLIAVDLNEIDDEQAQIITDHVTLEHRLDTLEARATAIAQDLSETEDRMEFIASDHLNHASALDNHDTDLALVRTRLDLSQALLELMVKRVNELSLRLGTVEMIATHAASDAETDRLFRLEMDG